MGFKSIFVVCLMTLPGFVHPKEKYDKISQHVNSWKLVPVYSHHQNHYDFYGFNNYKSHFPKYEFEYMVSDKKTGDHKRHKEAREGDRVKGEYSMVEPGDSLRKVQYEADDLHGFNAVVIKYMNKHGEDAYSTFTRTNYITPTSGYNFKINHGMSEMKKSRTTEKFKELEKRNNDENKMKNITYFKRTKEHEDETVSDEEQAVKSTPILENMKPVIVEDTEDSKEVLPVTDDKENSYNKPELVPIIILNKAEGLGNSVSNKTVEKNNADVNPRLIDSDASWFYKISRYFLL